MKSKPNFRYVAHLRWLERPHAGRAVYIVESGGRTGFVPATEPCVSAGAIFDDLEAALRTDADDAPTDTPDEDRVENSFGKQTEKRRARGPGARRKPKAQ